MNIGEAIQAEAAKLIRRHQRYATDLEDSARRIDRRSGIKPSKTVLSPQYWKINDGFDPYHVRAHAPSITYAISKAFAAGTYRPRPAISYNIPRDGAGNRSVSVFQVADNAISRLVYKQLLTKNSSRLSPHCYAYRTDITLHDAVLNIAADMRGRKRIFVAEFDFRKYFDSIDHQHIEKIIRDRRFFITNTELALIRSFLRVPTLEIENYDPNSTAVRECGIPQGTSISLFLANIAAQPLDHSLEKLGVGFARFADDTLIWSEDYSAICRASSALEDAALEMGVELNMKKSSGINILTPEGSPSEITSKSSVDFLGYNINSENIGMKEKSVERIKNRISHIIYSNLLQEPKRQNFAAQRVAPLVDRDYVVMLYQIRRYLYGNLNESQLRRYLARESPRIRYHGLMSFYPIVDDDVQLRKLDGWLLHTIFTSLRLRERLFLQNGFSPLPPPHGFSKSELLSFAGKASAGTWLDLRVPSFSRISKLLRNASGAFGANAVANSRTLYGAAQGSTRTDYLRVL